MTPPAFWFKSKPTWQAHCLTPLAWVWKSLHARRLKTGAWEKLSVPVVCVGNINLGGTGKTPTVIDILGRLQAMGRTPHVVSRGYGGRETGPLQVALEKHTANDVGDEPILLAAFAPTWIAKDRTAGARAAIKAGADIIVLDDGLQNPSLEKTLSIVVVDAAIGFGNGCVAPAGPLRESIESGLSRCDLLLSIGPENHQAKFKSTTPKISTIPHIEASLAPLHTGMNWNGLKVLAFAGIGRPQKFYDTLRGLGVEIMQTRSFGDHQKMPLAVLQRLESEAKSLNVQLVTTEKDAARLPIEYQQKVLTLPVRLDIKNPDALDRALAAL